MLKGTYAQSTLDPTAPETAGGVLFNLSTYLNGLRLIDGTESDSFSIRDWVTNDKKEDSFLFISARPDSDSEAKPLQTAWWEIAFKALLSRERGSSKKIWIILDELASLQQIPSLVDAMSKTREYGGCFVLGFQNIAQIEQIYGRDSKTLSSLCNTRCIFKTPDPDTAKWVSQNIGDQELEHVNEGLSYGAHQMRDGVSINKHTMIKSVVMPSEIQNLQDLELYIQMSGHPFVKTRIKWKERQIINQGLMDIKNQTESNNPKPNQLSNISTSEQVQELPKQKEEKKVLEELLEKEL